MTRCGGEPQVEVGHRRVLHAGFEALLEYRAALRELHPRGAGGSRYVQGRASRREIGSSEPQADEWAQPRSGREGVTRAEIERAHAVVLELRVERDARAAGEQRADLAIPAVELRVRRACESAEARIERVIELGAARVTMIVGAVEADTV